jgi:hypothetical protein
MHASDAGANAHPGDPAERVAKTSTASFRMRPVPAILPLVRDHPRNGSMEVVHTVSDPDAITTESNRKKTCISMTPTEMGLRV